MIKDDKLYQILLKNNFDLYRGEKSVAEYMQQHLSQYYNEISNSISAQDNPFLGEEFTKLLCEKLELLDEICRDIPTIIETYNNGFIKQAYEKSFALFEKTHDWFLIKPLWGNDKVFYRIRQGDFRINGSSDRKSQKTQLFHIKRAYRNRIGAYRYSIAGYPCLYMSSGRELAWFESGMPKQFSYCAMLFEENNENPVKLIDFSFRHIDFLSSISTWILNKRRQNKVCDGIYNCLLRYIITYPLMAACSIKVKDRGNKFVEEYVFPQLLMQWIRESDDIDGVSYKSSLNTDLVSAFGASNVALPVKKFREDGLDEKLTNNILVSDIGYIDVNKEFEKYKEIISEISQYTNELQMFLVVNPCVPDYIIELMDLCNCIIKTYTALIEGNYSNNELIFIHVNRLCEHANMIYKYREEKIEAAISSALAHEKSAMEEFKKTGVLNEHFEKFHNLTDKILRKNVVFEFTHENLDNYEKI